MAPSPSANVPKPKVRSVRGRAVPVCSHGECMNTCVWDYPACWTHMTSDEREDVKTRLGGLLRSGQSMKGLVLTGADLSGFDFTGANLSDAFLNETVLRGCKFIDTDLERAFLGWADLQGADLSRAELNGTVFTRAKLRDVKLLAYSISFGREPINLNMGSFGPDGLGSRPRINEKEPFTAEATYRALKRHFVAGGEYDSASWAAYSERAMQRKNLWRNKSFGRWAASVLFGLTCGYGEKPMRVFLAGLVAIAAYGGLYYGLGLTSPTTPRLVDVLPFSAAVLSGLTLPAPSLAAGTLAAIVATSESYLGLFLFGMLVFTLTKRYVAR